MKQCSKCHTKKPVTEFYSDSQKTTGLRPDCKSCTNERIKAYIATPAGRQVARRRSAKYRLTENGRLSARNGSRKYALANKLKRKASNTLNGAIRCGKITRPSECSVCRKEGKVHGHHEDYSKPLDVVWVCSICHSGIHVAEPDPNWRENK